jgi:GNAT superfamily N-acetyltransferase
VIRIQDTPGVNRARIGIRQACSSDRDAIKEFLAGLSPRTRYLRFFTGAPTATGTALRRLTGEVENVDAVVATEAGAIVGHAMAADTTGPAGTRVTEIGVAVTDTRQGQGVGTALTRELAARAMARGATALAMDVLAENRRVMAIIGDHWPTAHYDRSGPYVTIYAGLMLIEREADQGLAGEDAGLALVGEPAGSAELEGPTGSVELVGGVVR